MWQLSLFSWVVTTKPLDKQVDVLATIYRSDTTYVHKSIYKYVNQLSLL